MRDEVDDPDYEPHGEFVHRRPIVLNDPEPERRPKHRAD